MSDLLRKALAGEPLGGGIIDVHGHIGRYSFAAGGRSAGSMVDVMDRLGVRCIVASHMRAMSRDVEAGNEAVLEAMRRFPGRILGYASLWPSDAVTVEREVRRRLDEGFAGLKLHNINAFPYTDGAYAPAFDLADRRRLPVLLHTWGQAEEFRQVRQLSPRYPGAKLLLAHAGVNDEAAYVAVARECPNVYLDLARSASPTGQVARLADGAGIGKLLFGSDCCFLNMPQQLGKVIGADLTDDEKMRILRDNALDVLRDAEIVNHPLRP